MSFKKTIDRRLLLRSAGACSLGLAAPWLASPARAAGANAFPSKTIEILIGASPGGGTDRSARLISPAWAAELGAKHPVKNTTMKGASGVIAMIHMLRSKADGHTLQYFPITTLHGYSNSTR